MLCVRSWLAATAPIGPLAWEPPDASGAALKRTKKTKKEKKISAPLLREKERIAIGKQIGGFVIVTLICDKKKVKAMDSGRTRRHACVRGWHLWTAYALKAYAG